MNIVNYVLMFVISTDTKYCTLNQTSALNIEDVGNNPGIPWDLHILRISAWEYFQRVFPLQATFSLVE
jgi:hypothetical protein